jgi:hypothetical protein
MNTHKKNINSEICLVEQCIVRNPHANRVDFRSLFLRSRFQISSRRPVALTGFRGFSQSIQVNVGINCDQSTVQLNNLKEWKYVAF